MIKFNTEKSTLLPSDLPEWLRGGFRALRWQLATALFIPLLNAQDTSELPVPFITHTEPLADQSGFLVKWLSEFGQQFDLLRSGDLTTWATVTTKFPASALDESSFTFEFPEDSAREFYRVKLKEERISNPNIVMLFADDLGYGDLACYGHPYAKTPNLDSLASQGTLFRIFNVTGMTCNPSRTGILTSRHPNSFPLKTADYGFQGRVTIMELLNDAGYATGHFGKWHIGPDPVTNGTYGIDEIIISGGGQNDEFGRDQEVYENAIAFIEAHQDEPFYVNVMGRVTHAPVDPRSDLVVSAGFDGLQVERNAFDSQQIQENFDRLEAAGGNINESMAKYLAEVYFLDQFVGDLLAKLDELGLAENTIVMFSSDQGPAPVRDEPENSHKLNLVGYSGGLRGQKHDEHEGGVRVPFILRWPGFIPAGKVNEDSIVSALDWLPTLCRIAGVEIDPDDFHGKDVLDIWLGSDRSSNGPQFWNHSMKKDNWRIDFTNNNQAIELYNLATDFDETVNLVSTRPDIVAELTAIWEAWEATLT